MLASVEAASAVINEHQVYFLGGREHGGDVNKITYFDGKNCLDTDEMREIGNLQKKRCSLNEYQDRSCWFQ